MGTAGIADDIRSILRESGLASVADGVIAVLSAAAPAPSHTPLPWCDAVSPPEGRIVECQLGQGSTLEWMALRPGAAKGNRTPGRLQHVKWAGTGAVRVFMFRISSDREAYTFVIPAVCANLSLMSIADIQRRIVVEDGAAATEAAYSSSYRRDVTRTSAGSYSNMNAAIGWFNTPLGAGLRYGHPNVDYLENHLIWNRPSGAAIHGYPVMTQLDFDTPGPQFNLGWRGAYLSAPITGDPWGHRYFVNTMFLYADGYNPHREGYRGWNSNTFCLSAGHNGILETPFASAGYDANDGNRVRGGDDFVYVIAGGSR
jgi:hypothetical protein